MGRGKEDQWTGVAIVRWRYDAQGQRTATLGLDGKENLLREMR